MIKAKKNIKMLLFLMYIGVGNRLFRLYQTDFLEESHAVLKALSV